METFEDIVKSFKKSHLSGEEAATLLGCSERHFRRLRVRYEAEGLPGIADRRVGKTSPRRANNLEIERVTRLYREKYSGFNVTHFHEIAKREHGVRQGYTWTRTLLANAGLVAGSKRGGAHRLRRPRRPMVGMLIHQDASKHQWFGEDYCDLVVTMDDATSEITSAFFCEEEGTMSSFRGIHETISKNGLFCSLYTDRGSHYFTTMEAGGKVDKSRPTQVNRALKQLGIEHIAAYSPEARGRSERMFGTLQDRLVNELKLAGITTMIAANSYLQTYIPRHNERFMVSPASDESAYLPVAGFDIANMLCIQDERVVGSDNTVSYQGKKLQIPESPHRHHFVKAQVRVHHYPDDSLAIFHGPREIGRYNANGTLIKEEKKIAA
jgi:transposase